MKKLESLSSFQSRSLNKMEIIQIKGGVSTGTITSSGTLCVDPARSSTGCMSYSSDIACDDGSATYTPTNGNASSSDVNP
jgi:hypothetical protein